jgi:hypothetical protein
MPGCYQKKNPASTLPAPRYFCAIDNEKRKNAVWFFKFWESLPLENADFVVVKVYRTWPRVDLRLAEPSRRSIAWDFLEGPITFDPKDYRQWFLSRYNSGNWNFQMYELGGWSEVKVAECFFDAVDLERYPPLVDLHTVIWEDPRNWGYFFHLRQRGIPIPTKSKTVGLQKRPWWMA